MTPPEFLHQLAERFAPMSERSSTDLQQQSTNEYAKWRKGMEQIKEAMKQTPLLKRVSTPPTTTEAEKQACLDSMVDVPKMELKHKFAELAEQWWFRYLLAAVFVWVQPVIQRYINPIKDTGEDFEEE